MGSGPSEQLSPKAKGFMCSKELIKDSIFIADIIVSPPIPTAAEYMIGILIFNFSLTSLIATEAALAFKPSKIVSTNKISEPPSIRASI